MADINSRIIKKCYFDLGTMIFMKNMIKLKYTYFYGFSLYNLFV